MPQFILNTRASRADAQRAVAYGYLKPAKRRAVHPFNDLDEFAQGYVEAMFFTNGDIGDETRPDRLNEMGVSRLTRASVEKIEADCDRFQRFLSETGKALRDAKALIPGGEGLEHGREALDDRRLGQLFWYARQGHVVAFTDDGYADCLSVLQEAARAFGECYVEAWRGWIHVR